MNLAQTFAAAASLAGGVFMPAVAVWPGVPVFDAGGSIATAGMAVAFTCRAQFDRVTQTMRSDADFVESDVRILILANALGRPVDHEARIVVSSGANAGTWSLRSVERDPAGVGFECRGRRVDSIGIPPVVNGEWGEDSW